MLVGRRGSDAQQWRGNLHARTGQRLASLTRPARSSGNFGRSRRAGMRGSRTRKSGRQPQTDYKANGTKMYYRCQQLTDSVRANKVARWRECTESLSSPEWVESRQKRRRRLGCAGSRCLWNQTRSVSHGMFTGHHSTGW